MVKILPMTSAHISQVARLHTPELGTILGHFDVGVIESYYAAALRCDWCTALVAIHETEPIGAVLGSSQPERIWGDILRQGSWGLGVALVKNVVWHPKLARLLWDSLQNSSEANVHGIELVYLMVGQSHRSQGVGAELVAAFENQIQKQGADHYYLAVQKENLRARAFYQLYGFQEISAFQIGSKSYLRLTKRLANAS